MNEEAKSSEPIPDNEQSSLSQSPGDGAAIFLETDPVVASPGLNKIGLFLDSAWWERTMEQIWTFRKISLKPAILCTLGEIATILSQYLAWSDLINLSASGTPINSAGELGLIFLKAIIVMIIFGGTGLVLTCWGVGLWVIALTGFCRSSLSEFASPPGPDLLSQTQKKAVEYVRDKKMTILVVWLIYSLIMMIPFVVCSVSMFFILISIPGVLPYPVPFTREMIAISAVVFLITTLILTNHALLAMPLSAVSKHSGREIATKSLVMTVKALPAITICSVLMLVLSLLMFIPEGALLAFNTIDKNPSNMLIQAIYRVGSAIFHGATSIVIGPLCLALPCELIRKESRA